MRTPKQRMKMERERTQAHLDLAIQQQLIAAAWYDAARTAYAARDYPEALRCQRESHFRYEWAQQHLRSA